MSAQGKILVWPQRYIPRAIEARENVALVNVKNALAWKIGKIDVDSVPKSYTFFSEYDVIMLRLRQITEIYSRHYESLESLDLSLRMLVLQILALAEELVRQEIRVIVMPPHGSSHHLEDSMLELAGEVAKIPLIFTLPLPNSDRAVTLLQKGGITSRVPYRHQDTSEIADSLKLRVASGWEVKPISSGHLDLDEYLVEGDYRKAQIKQIRRGLVLSLKRDMRHADKTNSLLFRRIRPATDLSLLSQHRASMQFLKLQQLKHIHSINSVINNHANRIVLCIFATAQPEASSFPEGGERPNHLDIISYVRSLGYMQPVLYKEHPSLVNYSRGPNSFRVGVSRSISYYRALEKMGCLFVDPRFPIDECEKILPISMVGSIGLQRSLKGKSTIITGFPWYGKLPGTLRIEEALEDLDKALHSFDASAAQQFLIDYLTGSTLSAKPMVKGIKCSEIEIFAWLEEYRMFLEKLASDFVFC